MNKMKASEFVHAMMETPSIFGKKKNVRVVFEGEKPSTDGESVILPSIDQNKELKGETVSLMRGFVAHEAGHIKHSDFSLWERFDEAESPLFILAFTVLEDMRMEECVIKEYPGSRKNLHSVSEFLLEEHLEKMENREVFIQEIATKTAFYIPLGITWAGRRRYGIKSSCNDILELFSRKVRAKIEEWAERAKKCHSSEEIVPLAREVEMWVRGTIPPLPPLPSQAQCAMDDEGGGEGNDENDRDEDDFDKGAEGAGGQLKQDQQGDESEQEDDGSESEEGQDGNEQGDRQGEDDDRSGSENDPNGNEQGDGQGEDDDRSDSENGQNGNEQGDGQDEDDDRGDSENGQNGNEQGDGQGENDDGGDSEDGRNGNEQGDRQGEDDDRSGSENDPNGNEQGDGQGEDGDGGDSENGRNGNEQGGGQGEDGDGGDSENGQNGNEQGGRQGEDDDGGDSENGQNGNEQGGRQGEDDDGGDSENGQNGNEQGGRQGEDDDGGDSENGQNGNEQGGRQGEDDDGRGDGQEEDDDGRDTHDDVYSDQQNHGMSAEERKRHEDEIIEEYIPRAWGTRNDLDLAEKLRTKLDEEDLMKSSDASYRPFTTALDKWHHRTDHRNKYRSRAYDFNSTSYGHILNQGTVEQYNKVLADLGSDIHVMKSKMERALMAKRNRGWDYGKESGRLDSKRLVAAIQGEPLVFKTRFETPELDTAVSMVVDLSASMIDDEKNERTRDAVIAMAESIEKASIAYEILGFNNTSRHPAFSYSQGRYSRYAPIEMYIFKSFQETLLRSRGAISQIPSCCNGVNTDGESIAYAHERLKQRDESKKVLIVLSDGHPNFPTDFREHQGSHLVNTVKRISNSGVECIGIGIMDASVKRFYPKHIVINNVSELAREGMDQLAKMLLGERFNLAGENK